MARLEKQNKLVITLLGFALIGVIGLIDFLTGYEFSFSIFYVLPISLVTWLMGRRSGLASAMISALVWFSADLASGHRYSQPIFPIWNSFIRLGFFVIITLLLSELKKATEREATFARIDHLTGAVNSRLFYDLMQIEIDRLQRYKHPFTLAYIDLDNFKSVNDRLGHGTGDQVLRKIVNCTARYTRKTDTMARLGGDEFVLLLPETNEESAQVVLSKLHAGLLEEMGQNSWPITFSIGILTCAGGSATVNQLVSMADDLMYTAKHNGKNALKYSRYVG